MDSLISTLRLTVAQSSTRKAGEGEAQDIIVWDIATQEKKRTFPFAGNDVWPAVKFVDMPTHRA